MNVTRPINLNLTKLHFPPMAIVSVGHRISGFILFLFIPLMFYLLHTTTASVESFNNLQRLLTYSVWMKLGVWIMLSTIFFHLFAGIRHLTMDFGFLESVRKGRISAYMVFLTSLITTVFIGVWIW